MDDASDPRPDPASEAPPRLEGPLRRTAPPRPPEGAGPEDVFADPRPWAALAEADGAEAFLAAWLALQVRMIPGAAEAALFHFVEGRGFVPAARWPATLPDLAPLAAAAGKAAETGVLHAEPGEGETRLAFPLRDGGRVGVVVALTLVGRGARDLRGAARRLHWGAGWLSAHLSGLAAAELRGFAARAETALDLLAAAEEHARHDAAAMAVANELHTLLPVDGVGVGLVSARGRGARLGLVAMSRAAWFGKRAGLAQSLENAMGEALDQGATVAWPEPDDGPRRIAVAARDHAEAAGMGAVAVTVLTDRDGPCGALALMKRDPAPWDAETLALAEALGGLIGPALMLKRRQRRWISGRLADAVADGTKAVLGPRRPSLKLAAILGAAFLAYVSFAEATFRVSADATLEGAVQRAAAAPFDGFVAEAPARAGDVVAAGAVLARLDDADLRLEALRWRSEYARLRQEQRAAMAELDRAEVALLAARIEQAEARLGLAQARLARTEITAPIAGVVIAGDLSQRLGAPVSQGEVLFEIAPLADWRVAVAAPERDLRHIAPGQTGRLLLAGRADAALPFEVTRVTSVAEAAEGANTFRVEARLTGDAPRIRPGMEGVAKIDVEPRPILWIWTRTLIDWLRLFVWEWTP